MVLLVTYVNRSRRSNEVRRVCVVYGCEIEELLHLFSEKNEKNSKFKIQLAIPSKPYTLHGAYCTSVYAVTFYFSPLPFLRAYQAQHDECPNKFDFFTNASGFIRFRVLPCALDLRWL